MIKSFNIEIDDDLRITKITNDSGKKAWIGYASTPPKRKIVYFSVVPDGNRVIFDLFDMDMNNLIIRFQ